MKINAEIFNLITERASLFSTKDKGYLLSFTTIKTANGDFIAKLIAGNGQAQSSVVFPYSASEPLHEPMCLSLTLRDAVSAIAKNTEYVELNRTGNIAVLSTKSAKINIPLLTNFDQILPPDDELLTCDIDRKELLAAIKQGSASATDSEKSYASCIMMRPRFEGEDLFLSFFSVSATGRSYAHVKVNAKAPDIWMDKSDEKKTYLIPHASFIKLSSLLHRENTTLYLGDSCLLVRDGNDLFSFVTYGDHPKQDFLPFFNYSAASLKARIKVSAFEAALNAASIGIDTKNPMVMLSIKDNELTATCENGNSASAELIAPANGNWSGAFNPLQLRSILKGIGSDEVTIHSTGDQSKPVIYITADNVSAVSVATGFLH